MLVACGPGEPNATSAGTTDPGSDSTGTSGPEAPTSDATDPPTTAATTADTLTTDSEATPDTNDPGAPACGDGVLDDGELCDDGDPDPADGCDAACTPVPAAAWTFSYDGPASKNDGAIDVAVDPTGQIFVVGSQYDKNRDALLMVLSPDGQELWHRAIDGVAGRDDLFYAVELAPDGTIYVAGHEEVALDEYTAVVRALAPDGSDLWRFAEEPENPGNAVAQALSLADGALYSTGNASHELIARRHDLATGAADWRIATTLEWPDASGEAVLAAADRVIFVGYVQDNTIIRPLTLVVDPTTGEVVSELIQELPWGFWYGVRPIGPDGDLMFVGRTYMPGVIDRDVIVRRTDADFVEVWTQIYDPHVLEDMGNDVAVGANESIFVVGSVGVFKQEDEYEDNEEYDLLAARYGPDGAQLWIDTFGTVDDREFGNAAATGPGFFVVAGYVAAPNQVTNLWVRRYNDG